MKCAVGELSRRRNVHNAVWTSFSYPVTPFACLWQARPYCISKLDAVSPWNVSPLKPNSWNWGVGPTTRSFCAAVDQDFEEVVPLVRDVMDKVIHICPIRKLRPLLPWQQRSGWPSWAGNLRWKRRIGTQPQAANDAEWTAIAIRQADLISPVTLSRWLLRCPSWNELFSWW